MSEPGREHVWHEHDMSDVCSPVCPASEGREQTHDDLCESEFITGPMAWSPCGCEERSTGRKQTAQEVAEKRGCVSGTDRCIYRMDGSWMTACTRHGPTGREQTCTGAYDCPSGQHVHGCFADFGSCDNPAEHWPDSAPTECCASGKCEVCAPGGFGGSRYW